MVETKRIHPMIDLDKIKADTAQIRDYGLKNPSVGLYLLDVVGALVAEVEELRQLTNPAREILTCTCGHTSEIHTPHEWQCAKGCFCYVTLARAVLKGEETP